MAVAPSSRTGQSVRMPLLTEEAFRATMGEPMRPVEEATALPPDFWGYFDRIDRSDLGGYDVGEGQIEFAYREPTGQYDHVLLRSNDPDVFLVMVIDRDGPKLHGHFLLDLPRVYGLRQ
jgi:hypothetical protein